MTTVFGVSVRITGQVNATFDLGVWGSQDQADSVSQAVVGLLTPFAERHEIMFDVVTKPLIVNDLCRAVDVIGDIQTELRRII